MNDLASPLPNDSDDHVDEEIASCLVLDSPRSFFLFAGAGSGKTRSLVNTLNNIRHKCGREMQLRGQRIGVITYTNAACDEINRRLDFDRLLQVSTIHSFAWTLISGFNRDIREWLRANIKDEILKLQSEEAKGRKGTKASVTRLVQIESKNRRLARLDSIKKFVYSPSGDNRGKDSLNHSEVIKISADFLTSKPALQRILVSGFPILLIDESQDTNRRLLDAIFAVQAAHRERFSLGLFGDTMQRIYADGKEGLGDGLPSDWHKPVKRINHRCPKRVVELINKIRSGVDRQEQSPRTDSITGHVRLFIFSNTTENKPDIEKAAAFVMSNITHDNLWNDINEYKVLTLEHRMAARRMGFLDMFVPLHGIEEFRTGLLDGTLPATRFFADKVLPLRQAELNNDKFSVAKILRASSPLLSSENLRNSKDQAGDLKRAKIAVEKLMQLWSNGDDPKFDAILRSVSESGLFAIPDSLLPNAVRDVDALAEVDENEDEINRPTARSAALDEFLASSFAQIEPYASYVTGKASFDTHQGVKGLEFPRVMVIIDDAEARGFTFSYEKVFSSNQSSEKSAEATKRLLYVTCSRAEESLALVAYSEAPERVRQHVLREGWFSEEEIQLGI